MEGKKRYFYPGGNTSKGFYSYYDYILSQDKANKIFCMKGGPGTGKSTFMRKIGDELCKEGWDVDYLLCSSDPGSLDGVIIKDKQTAIIDGTAPHIVDPKTPGAVDVIVNLGEYWDEEGIRKNKDEILITNDYIRQCFANAYKYIGAAAEIYKGIEEIYSAAMKREEVYKNTAALVRKELSHMALSSKLGEEKKFFASAITPEGLVNKTKSLIENCSNVYILKTPIGVSGSIFLEGFRENAKIRGLDVECYYCPMNPDKKLEHIVIPEISLAIITSNKYHELSTLAASIIDMRLYIRYEYLEKYRSLVDQSIGQMDLMLDMAVNCLKDAKSSHDVLEQMYIPNMYFDKIEKKCMEVLKEIKNVG